MGCQLSCLGGTTSFEKGSFVRIPVTPPEESRAFVPGRPEWRPCLDQVVSHVGLVVGGGDVGGTSQSCSVAFVNFDSSIDKPVVWRQCRDEWLESVSAEQAADQLSDSDRALLYAFFYGELRERIAYAYGHNDSKRYKMSSFGPAGTVVRVLPTPPGSSEHEAFTENLQETRGLCGIVIKGDQTSYAQSITYVVFDFPAANAYLYLDTWLEKVNVASLDEEEAKKLCLLRDIVVEEETLYHQKIAERQQQDNMQEGRQEDDRDGPTDLAETMTSLSDTVNRLKALRIALSENNDHDDAGDETNDNSDCRKRQCKQHRRQSDGDRTNQAPDVSESLADQLNEAHKRELDLTRRLGQLEATHLNDLTDLKVCMERISDKLDHAIALFDRTSV